MDTSGLKKFAAQARTDLIAQVGARLDYVLGSDAVELRDRFNDIEKIKSEISKTSREALIERVAYLWFNRMTALRYMDANRYTDIGIVSPAPNQTQPEILAEAKTGSVDPGFASDSNKAEILSLLSGQTNATDPEGAAYRKLFLGSCNHFGQAMSFMFEAIADWTELLLPDDLLSDRSILSQLRAVMTKDACQDVEVIGWLYQFYIAEKKDAVFAGLKKNKKITSENIPAATQLFTPHWIVRYLVENSLGRLWLLNNPSSGLIDQMRYYIKPEVPEEHFLRISSPEEIKICDPACGSGHMLTYAFDLLYAIYEECGYDPSEIPGSILRNNLFGIEIDERAGALSAFALTMKARDKQRRFLSTGIQPNICVLENVTFNEGELDEYVKEVGQDLFTAELRTMLKQFEEAKNFGSLIVPKLTDVSEVDRLINAKQFEELLFLRDVHKRVRRILVMAEYLSPKYHVVVANPPYMGGKGMNGKLGKFAKELYPDSKSDLFGMFIERGFKLIPRLGYSAMVTMQSWMFLSSYEKLRAKLAKMSAVNAMVHMGNMVMGIAFGTAGTVWKSGGRDSDRGAFCFVGYDDIDSVGIPCEFPPSNTRNLVAAKHGCFYNVSAQDFEKIPGRPVAYWVSDDVRNIFYENEALKEIITPKQGTSTGDDETYVRFWHEVDRSLIGFSFPTLSKALSSQKRYFPLNKGGGFRRWYGNNEKLIKLGGESYHELLELGNQLPSRDKYFLSGITWSKITSFKISVRYDDVGFVFSSVGLKGFPTVKDGHKSIAYMNSNLVSAFTEILSPTLSIVSGDIEKLPYKFISDGRITTNTSKLIASGKSDWDAYETSWDFQTFPLLEPENHSDMVETAYRDLRTYWQHLTDEMQRLEEENNRIFIDAYSLQDELTPKVPLSEITLTCNPAYRYGGKSADEELEGKLRADTMREFLHYAVGCMFGRYSLDEPGFILANVGETLKDYLERVPEPTFGPDDDNIIPVLDGNWFSDDIVERFKVFLRTTFGTEKYAENLAYIEASIGKKIRDWFLKDFYSYHWKRYKKRPIYWMISSPKGSFNVLFYMHRYRAELFSQVLEDYLRPFQSKLEGHLGDLNRTMNDSSASALEIKTATKAIDNIRAIQRELQDWERDVLYPLAGKRLPMDLDDGVKVNYPRFAPALKKIPGL